ncbi:Sec-independent protein translocase TatC [Halocalculus aciditolerans]|uniref:Sec-independent protein translocase protein TatC n=2 Tax=Halocalculus aciditolerans TaxID=1383812 RepID=A0A830F7C4_9EURY|nr:Sec-independent protein translocase TatC [Halocalculus aciditolerans]
MLRTVQKRLQKVFIAFVVGLFAGIVAMRVYIWPRLKADLVTNPAIDIIFQTPFDVILLQVKIGMIVGGFVALPVLLYFARNQLVERGMLPDVEVAWWKTAVVGAIGLVLFALGVAYSYLLFFPIMFDFLASNAVSASLKPTYSIVMWTNFIVVLALSFGLAAQLPLAMGGLSYFEVVPYETFRDNWKYAVVAIFAFGALFSPPDPFTQIMWAAPLLILYGLSLYIAKVVTTMRRGSERLDLVDVVVSRWNFELGGAVVAGALGYAIAAYGAIPVVNDLLAWAGSDVTLPAVDPLVLGAGFGVLGLVVAVLAVVYVEIEAAASQEAAVYGGQARDPENLNLSILDADAVRAAPDERFYAMDEDEAVRLAGEAMEDDQPEKAQAILDRFDSAEEAKEAEREAAEAAGETPSDAVDEAGETDGDETGEGEDEGEGNLLTRTSAGMLNPFTEEETTEEDVGGYYYDIAFVLDSLRSRAIWLVGWFMLVLAVTFYVLYAGALGDLKRNFLSRLPPQVVGDVTLDVVTLHPVEALVFMAKVSALFAAIMTLPVFLYFAWPALEDRGVIRAPRRIVALWFTGLVGALVVGSVVGYLYIAPGIISWLVFDAEQAGMQITYRVSNFLWLVFLTTAGIGLLADVPITMWLLYLSDLLSFRTMYERWRVAVVGSFVVGALVTPESVYTMFIVAFPLAGAFLLGLGVLYLVTLGGRREGGGGSDDPRASRSTR